MDLDQMRMTRDLQKFHSFLPVHRAFSVIAGAHPEKTAILHGGGSLSYGDLNRLSNRIAHHLGALAIGPGAIVGLRTEASAASIAAILGILKTGAAYLPLDPSYPAKLLAFIHEDSAPVVTLVSRQQGPLTTSVGKTLVIEDLLELPTGDGFDHNADISADDLAYVMYTSGSTGRPKGVMVPHRAIARLVLGADYASFGPDEVFLQQAPLSFDAATFEIWGPLLNGGTLAIPSGGRASLDDIADAIQRFGVTTLWLTAGLFHLMVEHRLDSLRPLRQLLAGGDVLSATHVRKLRREAPSCRLINGYGPTENTTFSCCYAVPAGDGTGSIPIGTPIHGTTAYVLDEDRRPVVDGESGELYLGGQGLALGYLNQPALTAEKFVPHPFEADAGSRLYRTGDRVRRRSDGNLDFLGRVDRQVKINGKRIELDEIEATVRRSGFARDAAAVVADAPNGARLISLFVTPPDGETGSVEKLRGFIAEELPDYMMPPRIEFLTNLPLSPTGKVDRNKLLETILAPRPPAIVTALDGTARQVKLAWTEALGTDAFGLDDNFFDLGGTSLQLVGMHAALQRVLGRSLPLMEIFSHPTVRSLARWLDVGTMPAVLPNAQNEMAAKRNAALARARLSRGLNLS